MPFEELSVVIDAGSESTKAGFAGESFPRCITRTLVGRVRKPGFVDGLPDFYFGDHAVKNRGILHLSCPITDGAITDWDEMEKLWHHLFYSQLHVPPEQAKIVHAVHAMSSIKEKKKITEILFEVFAIKCLYIAKAPILSLFSAGRTTGVVWGCGHSCCSVTPVFEGFPLEHATITSELSGSALTDYLRRLLNNLGYQLTTAFEMDVVNDIKENLCYLSSDYDAEVEKLKNDPKASYKLPDGQEILLGPERTMCPEVFFQPGLADKNYLSIPDIIFNSINKCDIDYRPMFFKNIVVSGGSTMFPSLMNRLKSGVRSKIKQQSGITYSQDVEVKVDGIPNRSLSAWAGGSMMAGINSMKGFWLTREEYEDCGDEKVIYKFF